MAGPQTGRRCLGYLRRDGHASIVCFDRVRLYEPACEQFHFDAMRAGLGLGNDERRQAGWLACAARDCWVERAYGDEVAAAKR
jgi:hypothetical protein